MNKNNSPITSTTTTATTATNVSPTNTPSNSDPTYTLPDPFNVIDGFISFTG
jgi:hypothetical protein